MSDESKGRLLICSHPYLDGEKIQGEPLPHAVGIVDNDGIDVIPKKQFRDLFITLSFIGDCGCQPEDEEAAEQWLKEYEDFRIGWYLWWKVQGFDLEV